MAPMDDATAFSARDWMALGEGSARAIFGGAPAARQALYRRLVKRWHPDRNRDPLAHDVFVRLQALYAKATVGTDSGDIEETVVDGRGRRFRFAGQAREAFELGTFLRGQATLAYRVAPAHEDLFANAVARVQGLAYATDAMRQQMAPLLPGLHAHPWGPEGGLLVLRRDPAALRLRDLAVHYRREGQSVPAEHVAWILSGLFHLACYLEHAGLAHHGIGLDSAWVVPERHTVHLWGGWFYARRFGEPLAALPSAAADMAAHRYLEAKVAGPGLDRALIRAVGRELLGDRQGQRIPATAAPKPFIDALRMPAGASAVEDYRAWKAVLRASFGPPTFVPMTLNASTLYPH